MSMRAFRERFREESWFQQPQGRQWPGIEKALERFEKNELKKAGGKINKETSKRDFDRFKIAYESQFFQLINDFLKRDLGVKNGLFAAMGAGAATLGQGHVYWMGDMTGDDGSQQAAFDALTDREQRCAVHLQELSRDQMLYHIELVVSDEMRMKLVELKRQTEANNNVVQWSDAVELMSKQLKNLDTRFLAESVFTVRRDDGSALIEWTLFFINMMSYCTAATIRLPTKLYYSMFMGQVCKPEIKHVAYAYPSTEDECDAFDFDAYRDAVKALPQDKFPAFHQNQVRGFTKHMLVSPGMIRDVKQGTEQGTESSGNNSEKYCKSCECKHPKGKHTSDGKNATLL